MQIIGVPDNQRPNKWSLTALFCNQIKGKEMCEAFSKNREGRRAYRIYVETPEGKRPLGSPSVDGRIILSWIFRKCDVGLWTGSSWFRIGADGEHL
jgi:hypothetical protein